MRSRLPIAISLSALVVAVLGVSPLGGAAIHAGTRVASGSAAKVGLDTKTNRGPRGPRGRRGPRGFLGRPGQRGPTGLKGPTGQKGATGAAGVPATQRWAVVAANGTVVRSRSLVASNPVSHTTGTGTYTVAFANTTTGSCAWAATIASTATSAPSSGYMTLNQGAFTNVVQVNTYATGGMATDQPFMLTLFC
jgi:hypothetical protein